MVKPLAEHTLASFIGELGSSSPAPGGGSAAALAGAKGAALLSMYCRLSTGKEKYTPVEPLMERTAAEAAILAAALIANVDRDTEAFRAIVEAMRLPREREAEKERRREAIQNATLQAARLPLETAGFCLQALELIAGVAGRGNPAAASDLAVANLLAMAGLEGAICNVRINLDSLQDQPARDELAARAGDILNKGLEEAARNRALLGP